MIGAPFGSDPEEKLVFVLNANSLQKWLIIKDEPDKMYYSAPMEDMTKEAFADKVWVSHFNSLNRFILSYCNNFHIFWTSYFNGIKWGF